MNAIGVNSPRGAVMPLHVTQIHQMVRAFLNSGAKRGPVVWPKRVAEDLEARLVVEPRNGLHQMRRRVVAEVGRKVADLQSDLLLGIRRKRRVDV